MATKPPVEVPQGAIRLNTDSQKLEFFAQDQWWEMATDVSTLNGGTRGLLCGGYENSPVNAGSNQIQYITVETAGNSIDFGDMCYGARNPSSLASNTRAITCGGINSGGSHVNTINASTFATTGSNLDFGDMSSSRSRTGAVSNQTRGVFMGGAKQGSPGYDSRIGYITIASTGNAVDSGFDVANNGQYGCSFNSPVRGFYGCTNADLDAMEYITIASLGNGTEFTSSFITLNGDFEYRSGSSNTTRGFVAGGYDEPAHTSEILSMEMASLGNAVDFGDLTVSGGTNEGTGSKIRMITWNRYSSAHQDVIDYFTAATTGNAVDFGDQVLDVRNAGSTSNNHGGL